ncbi:aminofutalosine synthase MqnE [candidate division BRC1 bacterium HGW-BRC1-1]|nr:MAG: aminofutalosine synthase MqnE [candidate division BRC1 bacterium HGW-BRC1-1]
MQARYTRAGLADIFDKVQAGERLSGADGLRLYETPDLQAVGALANIVRERKSGNFAYFNRNLRIDYTNVCNKQCLFCAFDRLPGEPGGYVLQREDIHARLHQYDDVHVTEVHIIGGIHPRLPFSYYIDLLGWVREVRPDIHIKAFTMVEIAQMIKISGLGPEGTVRALMDAGLQSCPGGGAEVLNERVHRELFRIKIGPAQWLELQKMVHQCGLRSTATMLYGHIETAAERIEHIEKLRALQDETGGFQTFIPLAFHPANTELSHLPAPSAFDDLRNIAVGRLMLDNFDHVKAYWIMMSAPISQIALAYGADDVDGTTLEETVFHEAGAVTPTGMTVESIVRMLREAGRTPVERDTLYQHLRVYDSAA